MTAEQLRNSILQEAISGRLVPPACRQAGKTLTMNPTPHLQGKKVWFTYVIECEDGTFYKGFTDDLVKRYKQHCDGIGAEHTKIHKPKQLYYWEMHYSQNEAIAREKYLKSGSGREWFLREVVNKPENWEPASVLLEKIRDEKARLIKEGKLKKEKPSAPITDDEKPFEIPASWEWVRVQDIVQINPKNTAEDNAEAAFIPMELIDATYFSSFTYKVRKWKEIKSGFTHFANGDIAFAKITPCFQNRKSMILHNLPNGIGAGTTELKVLRTYGNTIVDFYLLFFLESAYFVEQAEFKGTANQQRIISGYLENKLFPLPPLAEQQRIVAKLEELLPMVEQYGKAQTELDELNAALPARLRQSVLQQAIQGKLVPQDPNEGTAEELLKDIGKLPITTDSEYILPENWSTVGLMDICQIDTGKWDANHATEKGDYRFYTCSAQHMYSDTKRFSGECLIVPGNGDIGAVYYYSGEFDAYQRTYVLHDILIDSRYLYYHLLSNWRSYNMNLSYGSTIKYVRIGNFKNYIVNLPPLAEQQRIVAKIEELFAEIDKLTK